MSSARTATDGPCILRVVTPDGAEVGVAVAEEVSAGAAVLQVFAFPSVGGTLLLEPATPLLSAGRRLAFRVVSCVGAPGGGYCLAGTFDPPLADVEVRALAGASAV